MNATKYAAVLKTKLLASQVRRQRGHRSPDFYFCRPYLFLAPPVYFFLKVSILLTVKIVVILTVPSPILTSILFD